jgi:ABC-2 type transport system ATP-binding protein
MLCKNVAIIDHGEIIENANMKSLLNRISSQTVIMELEEAPSLSLALGEFQHRMLDDSTIEVKIHKTQSLNDLFDTLTKKGLRITSMRNKTNRLEELFISLITENKSAQA